MAGETVQVFRDKQGRYRDARGRWAKDPAGELRAAEEGEESLAAAAQRAAQQQLVAAVQEMGHRVSTAAEAWGVLVGHQAGLALEAGKGAQTIAAAKLVAQAIGVLEEDEAAPEEGLQLKIGAGAARQVLGLIEEVLAERGE